MSRSEGLLDTSVVVRLSEGSIFDQLPEFSLICAITLAELSVGPLVATDLQERSRRQALLQEIESMFDPLPIDAAAARAFGRVGAELRHRGSKARARSYDALIASVAIAHQLPLYTVNPADFYGISGLDVVAVS